MSSGGGNAGKIDFPDHMKNAHKIWLNHNGVDTPDYSVVDLMNAAWAGDTPLTGASAYDPTSNIATYVARGVTFASVVDTLGSTVGLDTLCEDILSDDALTADVNAFADVLDADLDANVYPRFEAGMRDINAVLSSAFVLGRANIEASRNREVAKFQSTQRVQRTNNGLQLVGMKLQYLQAVAHTVTEQQRIAIAAGKEQVDYDLQLDVLDRKWDLEIYAHGQSLLGSIGGGTYVPKKNTPDATTSAVAGAISGASAGSSMGGWGALAGAVIGGVSGYLGAQ